MAKYFTPELYRFFDELIANNNRLWFNANKERYIEWVRDPMSSFIAAMQEPLSRISAHIVADPRPVGGSMFRIYRDTRFSKDKTPYKSHAASHFRHTVGRDVHGPGFYFHLGPDKNEVGGGIWRPETAVARQIRQRIVDHPRQWETIVGDEAFVARFGGLQGEQLKRVPREYDPDHHFGDDLRRKDFVVSVSLTRKNITGNGLVEEMSTIFAAMSPLMGFIAKAIGLPW